MIAVTTVSAYLLLATPYDTQITRDLVTKMAARDASAQTLLESPDSLRVLAEMMGLVSIPGSATLSVENLLVAAPAANPSASKAPNTDSLISASWTIKWAGKDSAGKAVSGKIDQKMTAAIRHGTDGKGHFIDIKVSPALTFDLSAYFSASGKSEADANKVAEDLRSGTKWIPGVTVSVTPRVDQLNLPPVLTSSPAHLTTWTQTVTPEVVGSQTTWSVQVSSAYGDYGAISPATVVTTAPVAAQVNVGAITPDQATALAAPTALAFWAAIEAGDVAKANSLISSGPKLDARGMALMKGWGATSGGVSSSSGVVGTATEGHNGPQDRIGNTVYVMASDGTWTVDTSRSHLIASSLSGAGDVYPINASSPSEGCSTQIKISLSRVVFYTDTPAEAIFRLSSSANCDMGDEIIEITVGWTGNSAGTQMSPGVTGAEPGTTVDRTVTLPAELKSGMGPVWIKITSYGEPNGGTLPGVMSFSAH
ncbi:MAG TPA: hypothetical protein VF375_09260 [Candidatus Limnocylindrales bacterium]